MASFSFGDSVYAGSSMRAATSAAGFEPQEGVMMRFSDEAGDDTGMISPENRYEFNEGRRSTPATTTVSKAGLVGGVGVSYRVAPRIEVCN